MSFIDRSALSLARSIRKHNSEASSEHVLKYSLALLINTSISITASFIICLMTGHAITALITILSLLTIRYFSGGMHLNSSLACCIATVIIIVFCSHMEFNYNYFFVILDIFSCLILLKTAPQGIQDVSSINVKFYPFLKVMSVLIVIANLYINSTVLSSVFFIQSLLTTPLLYKIRDSFEKRR